MAASRLHQLILVLASGLPFKSITPDALTPLSLKMPVKDSESVDVRLTIERYLVLDFLLCFHRIFFASQRTILPYVRNTGHQSIGTTHSVRLSAVV